MRAALIASAVIALGASLSGCIAYDVASTAVGVTTTVVSTTADVAGAAISAPFGHDDSDKKKDSK